MTTRHKIEFSVDFVGQEYRARIDGIDAAFSGSSEEEAAARLLSWLAEQFSAKATRASVKAREEHFVAYRIMPGEYTRERSEVQYGLPPDQAFPNKK